MGKSIKTVALFYLFFLATMTSGIQAAPYRPQKDVTVLVENLYHSSPSSSMNSWRIRVQKNDSDEGCQLDFLPEGNDSPICHIEMPAANGMVKWHASDGREQKSPSDGLLYVKGFPAPCNILPVAQKEAEIWYKVTSQVEDRVFVRNYLVRRSHFPFSEAVQKGYIKFEFQEPIALYMFSVVDEQGRELCRQLWPKGGDWWLYEDTPFRRSWRTE